MEHKSAIAPDLTGRTILQVIPELETGGAERTTQEVACAIVRAGGTSLVVSAGGRLVPQIEQEGSRHIIMPVASKNPLIIWKNAGRLAEIIKAAGVDIVHARSRAPAWSCLWAARREGVRYVSTYHGIYRAQSASKRLYNSAMARGDRVIANSRYTASTVTETYQRAGFFEPSHMVVIPRGADLARFDPARLDPARRKAALEAFGEAPGLRILLPGRLTSWKGQSVAVAAARLLRKQKPDVPFRAVFIGSAQGRDSYEANLRTAIEEAGLSDHVHILGHWDDMPAAYDWADVTLSTSTRPEAFGRVAVEAQAMGTPVIAAAHGGALETVVDGKTGFLVPPSDPVALADALLAVSTMAKADRCAMGQAGKERVETLFSVEAMTNATLSVYMSLTGNAGAELLAVR
ncbi:MAG: glycosyltransferase family 4 protein [Parvularcula sp.]